MKETMKSNNANVQQEILVHERELIKEVDELTDEMKKQNSRPRMFWRGIIDGLGKAIGATLGFAILIAILSFILSYSSAPWVRDVLDWLGIAEYFNN